MTATVKVMETAIDIDYVVFGVVRLVRSVVTFLFNEESADCGAGRKELRET